MSSSLRLTPEDVRRVEDVVRAQRMPPFVDGFDVEYGDDHDGDPAVWVVFKLREGGVPVTRDLAAIQPQIDAMNRLSSDTLSNLVELVPDRIVYVRFTGDLAERKDAPAT